MTRGNHNSHGKANYKKLEPGPLHHTGLWDPNGTHCDNEEEPYSVDGIISRCSEKGEFSKVITR